MHALVSSQLDYCSALYAALPLKLICHLQLVQNSAAHADDESLKYLTHEEQDVLMFFKETIDSFEEDIEDQETSNGLDDSDDVPDNPHLDIPNLEEQEDIIDLVQNELQNGEHTPTFAEPSSIPDDPKVPEYNPAYNKTDQMEKGTENSSEPPVQDHMTPPPSSFKTPIVTSSPKNNDLSPVDTSRFFVGHSPLHGSVPTPVLIAQKIADQQAENEKVSPISPRGSQKNFENRKTPPTSPSENGEHFHKQGPVTAPKPTTRFPYNISVSITSKEYGNTITKAAVKVQERKAQVLANLNGTALYTADLQEKPYSYGINGQNKSASFKDHASVQTRYEALSKLGLVKEVHAPVGNDYHVPAGCYSKVINTNPAQSAKVETISNGYHNANNVPKTGPHTSKVVSFKVNEDKSEHKSSCQNASQSFDEKKPLAPPQDIRRSRSLPKSSGFRPPGITVQFAGRGSTEESRREALRKLGLLKDTA
ncbi:proline and serine-rich protein 2 [Latimeria chalumnae]|uniref:proline and serine-rich protein 2 n=1 Tax=Latimeria chalumnae TaxID=7897 RepID=UPI00313C16AC